MCKGLKPKAGPQEESVKVEKKLKQRDLQEIRTRIKTVEVSWTNVCVAIKIGVDVDETVAEPELQLAADGVCNYKAIYLHLPITLVSSMITMKLSR